MTRAYARFAEGSAMYHDIRTNGFPDDYFVHDPAVVLIRQLERFNVMGKICVLAGAAVGITVATVGLELIPLAHNALKYYLGIQQPE